MRIAHSHNNPILPEGGSGVKAMAAGHARPPARIYWGCRPAALITLPHFAWSFRMKVLNSAGVIVQGS